MCQNFCGFFKSFGCLFVNSSVPVSSSFLLQQSFIHFCSIVTCFCYWHKISRCVSEKMGLRLHMPTKSVTLDDLQRPHYTLVPTISSKNVAQGLYF